MKLRREPGIVRDPAHGRRRSLRLAVTAAVIAAAGLAALGASLIADARDTLSRGVAAAPSGTLEFRFFDVGQGDAALVTSPPGKKLLVDAGPSNASLSTRLRAAGIDTIDLVVASHNHADHIGGMTDVLGTFVVRNYMENGLPHTTATYARVVTALERRRVPVLRAVPRSIDLGGGVSARVLPIAVRDSSQNNRSVGLLLRQGAFAALFTGDAEVSQRRFWADSADLPRVHLLKVSHHGAANGTDPRWLATVRPCVAIVSVGRNSYGHPAPATMDALGRAGAKVFRTDESGDIIVRVESGSDVVLLVQRTRGALRDSVERVRCEAA